jgi:hypothetical protein
MAGTKGNSGGKRAGAGRPAKPKHQAVIERAEKRIADRLPEILDNLFHLATGGYERIEEEWEPAGTVIVDGSEIVETERGPRAVKVKRSAYPDRPADELVLVRRRVSIADKDRAANTYLADRILGRPTERQELSTPEGGAIRVKHDLEELRGLPPEELVRLYRELCGGGD